MANELSDPLQERTFQYQNSLPPLPVPSLEGSLSKYLDAGETVETVFYRPVCALNVYVIKTWWGNAMLMY